MKDRLKWVGPALAAMAIFFAAKNLIDCLRATYSVVGTATFVNPLFSLVGICGGVLLFLRRQHWKKLLGVWCVFQILHFAIDTSGLWFYQMNTLFTYSYSTTRSVNEQIVSFQSFGANLNGILLTLVFVLILKYRLYRETPDLAETPQIEM